MSLLPRDVVSSDVINSRDHGAIVIVVVAFSMTCFLLFLLIRLAMRWPLGSLSGIDDLAVVLATCIGIAQVGTVIAAVHEGFGRTNVSPSDDVATRKLLYSSDILYIVVEFSSRLVVGLMFIRLSASSTQKIISWVIIGACIIFGIASAIAFAIQSNPFRTAKVVNPTGLLARWIAIETMSMTLDISCIIFPIWLVHGLEMQPKRKFQVVIGFVFRLPLLVLSPLRLASLSTTLWSRDFLFDYSTTEIYTQVLMSFSLASATIPCLRIFLGSFTSGMLGGDLTVTTGSRADTKGSGTKGSSQKDSKGSRATRSNTVPYARELKDLGRGITRPHASRASGNEADDASDSSQRAIVVQQTLDVQYDADSTAERVDTR